MPKKCGFASDAFKALSHSHFGLKKKHSFPVWIYFYYHKTVRLFFWTDGGKLPSTTTYPFSALYLGKSGLFDKLQHAKEICSEVVKKNEEEKRGAKKPFFCFSFSPNLTWKWQAVRKCCFLLIHCRLAFIRKGFFCALDKKFSWAQKRKGGARGGRRKNNKKIVAKRTSGDFDNILKAFPLFSLRA